MAPRPWRPERELDGALQHGNLSYAVALSRELAIEHGRPIPLETALRFLPLVIRESPQEFDSWALRWLARWIAENPQTTIEQTADIASWLSELPVEPKVLASIRESAGW